MMNNKIEFETVDDDENTIGLAVLLPSPIQQQRGNTEYAKAFRKALENDAMFSKKLQKHIVDQGLWDDQREAKRVELTEKIRSAELALKRGGIKKSEGRRIALQLLGDRSELTTLLSEIRSLESMTAEGQAQNHRFNYFVSACTVYKDSGKPYFKDIDDYLIRSTSQAALDAATHLAELVYGMDKDFEANLPENKFLRQFKYVDDQLRFIDEKGRFVDSAGKLVDEAGRYIDEDGKLIDIQGNPVDETGELLVETLPFLDDDGNPIE